MKLEFHGRPPAPLRLRPSRDNVPPTIVAPKEERSGDVDVATETEEVVFS